MKKRLIYLIEIFILFPIILLNCKEERELNIFLRGRFNEIVYNSKGLKFSEKKLKDIFHKIQYTPREEYIFELSNYNEIPENKRKTYRYYIVISSSSSESYKLFKDIFGIPDRAGIYKKENPFLPGSFAIGIYADKEQEILRILEDKKKEIFNMFYERMLRYNRKIAYFPGINKKLTQRVKEKLGIEINIPNGYRVFKETKNLISFTRKYPNRFVFFLKKEGEIILTPENVVKIRNKITKDIYAGDRILKKYLKYEYIELNSIKTIFLYGAWENRNLKVGGGFESFAFNFNGNFYLIDIGVYAPEKFKLKYLKRMESWVRTFKIKGENGKKNN